MLVILSSTLQLTRVFHSRQRRGFERSAVVHSLPCCDNEARSYPSDGAPGALPGDCAWALLEPRRYLSHIHQQHPAPRVHERLVLRRRVDPSDAGDHRKSGLSPSHAACRQYALRSLAAAFVTVPFAAIGRRSPPPLNSQTSTGGCGCEFEIAPRSAHSATAA